MRPIVFAGKGIADELSFLLPPGAKMKRRACCATPIADEPGVDQERDDEALYRAAVVSKQDGSIADEPVENLSQLVATVVASEGPISGSLLNDRIKSGFGVSSLRAGAAENLRVALKAAMAAGLVFETDPGFFQPAHCDVRVRNRRGQPEKVRALSNLPPSETRAGIIAEIVAEPLSEEVLICGVAKRLGYSMARSQSNPALAKRIGAVLRELIDAGIVAVLAEGKISRAPAAGAPVLAEAA